MLVFYFFGDAFSAVRKPILAGRCASLSVFLFLKKTELSADPLDAPRAGLRARVDIDDSIRPEFMKLQLALAINVDSAALHSRL